MSVFRSRPAVRWLVPAAAAALVIGGGAAAGTLVASADPALPARSAAQLLVDVQTAHVDGLSGTVVETADLGLPAMPGLTGGQGDTNLTKLIAGSNTARVWYAGRDKVRLALMGTLGETDVVRNGPDVWLWRSSDNTARHMTIPPGHGADRKPTALPSGVPMTPQEAADAALAAIDPTTKVSTTGAAKVAGRDAYELILEPRDGASLVGQVRLAIDAKQHIPLRVDVYAKGANNPAVRVAFQQISFSVPDAQQFVFNPPPGAKVTEDKSPDAAGADQGGPAAHRDAAPPVPGKPAPPVPGKPVPPVSGKRVQPGAPSEPAGARENVVGEGWTSVLVVKAPSPSADSGPSGAPDPIAGVINGLPKVSGSWGSGRLLTSALFSALVTDDGRILVGAVSPDRLYQVAATDAGK